MSNVAEHYLVCMVTLSHMTQQGLTLKQALEAALDVEPEYAEVYEGAYHALKSAEMLANNHLMNTKFRSITDA